MSGPDLTNELRGVLHRFREDVIVVIADIEGMFHAFKVTPQDKDALRFFWVDKDGYLIELRATTHIFGCKSSPAVANYCLRKIGRESNDLTPKAKQVIEKSFCISFPR